MNKIKSILNNIHTQTILVFLTFVAIVAAMINFPWVGYLIASMFFMAAAYLMCYLIVLLFRIRGEP